MRTDPPCFAAFAYGSLMFEPEWPEVLIDIVPARLPGYRRAFNKRSRARGCAAGSARWSGLDVPHGFRDADTHYSLALGTEPDPDAAIEGALLRYPAHLADAVRARLDAREGYDPTRLPASGYLRETVQVTLDDGAPATVETYLTHRASRLYVGELPPETTARILLHATPRSADRALGVDYLVGVHRSLRAQGREDTSLDTLVAALLALDGPWREPVTAALEAR